MSLYLCLTSYKISEFGQFPNPSKEEFDEMINEKKKKKPETGSSV